jgi:hypothetical protein
MIYENDAEQMLATLDYINAHGHSTTDPQYAMCWLQQRRSSLTPAQQDRADAAIKTYLAPQRRLYEKHAKGGGDVGR